MAFKNEAAVNEYYAGQKAPVEAELQNAQASYEAAIKRLKEQKAAEDAAAYRSYMRQQIELPGIMRAQGNHGGMVDSAVAGLANKYNQGRANRSVALNTNLANQELQNTQTQNSLRAKLAQLEQEAAAQRANLKGKYYTP